MREQNRRRIATVFLGVFALLGLSSCNDINKAAAPIEMTATFDSNVLVADLADPDCGENGLGELTLSTVIKQPNPVRTDLMAVRLRTMQVTYSRNDGGTVVPRSFVQSISGLIGAGGSGDVSGFLIFQPSAFAEAPFAALLPVNGGRDPETGNSSVGLEITIEVFGETLAGDRVSASTRFPLTICVGCGCVEVE
jgi:hypothetical protein